MTQKINSFIRTALLLVPIVFGFYCSSPGDGLEQPAPELSWLNLHDTVDYVGMDACKQCHADVHASYRHTGMGSSFDNASRTKSSAEITNHSLVYDKFLNLYYKPFWKGDSLYIKELRIEENDTVYQRSEYINFIVGSGQHTNSHLYSSNGYLFQAPLTYYTQKRRWDLPPGFEDGFNQRFARIVGLECMSCHNALPEFVKGSENKFRAIGNGIDCERCHGPGELHVAEKQKGVIVDTSKYADRTIVNPAKLSADLQFDVCQRCHLQGNAVLVNGKSFLDFKPGMRLSDVMHVYLPRYDKEGTFIMASHAERLKQSSCFIESERMYADSASLRPYKNALTCVSCHNPHLSVTQTEMQHFIQKCQSCHTSPKAECTENMNVRKNKNDDCVSCHMPMSGSVDIPHVSIHDHYIRKRPEVLKSPWEGSHYTELEPVNLKNPPEISRIRAYLQQFERFDRGKAGLLDTAGRYLQGFSDSMAFDLKVQYHFLREEYREVVKLVFKEAWVEVIKRKGGRMSWDNNDAWTWYRVGESLSKLGYTREAYLCLKRACRLAPYIPEFLNKYGNLAIVNNREREGIRVFADLVREAPTFVPALNNLGYLNLLSGNDMEAEHLYRQALALEPDNVQALLNMAGLNLFRGRNLEAESYVSRVLKLNRNHTIALELKNSLQDQSK